MVATTLLLGTAGRATSLEIEGVEFADEVSIGGVGQETLLLKGAGLLRYRVVFRGYVAALYMPRPLIGRAVAIDEAVGDVGKRLEIEYFWSLAAGDFASAAERHLAATMAPAELAEIAAEMKTLHRAYRDVEPGDRYSLTYLRPGRIELRLNDELLVSVPGKAFAQAYFGLWLGDEPLDSGLRDDLLGRRSPGVVR